MNVTPDLRNDYSDHEQAVLTENRVCMRADRSGGSGAVDIVRKGFRRRPGEEVKVGGAARRGGADAETETPAPVIPIGHG